MKELEDLSLIPAFEYEEIRGMWYVYDPVTECMGCGNDPEEAKEQLYGNIDRITG